MTRLTPNRVNTLDLPAVTVSTRRAGELLAHPCLCGRKGCTIGEHVLRSTKELEPGQHAQQLDPSRTNPPDDAIPFPDLQEPPDATEGVHNEYRRLIAEAHNACDALAVFIDRYRPDRTTPLPGSTGDLWCRVCLSDGRCEPRHRGDLCSWDYSFRRIYHIDPPAELVKARHLGQRITQRMVADAIRHHRSTHRKRRHAS